MDNYFYTAKSFEGETISGNKQAKDEYELARILRTEGYILINAEAKRKRIKSGLNISLGRITSKEKLFFTRNLRIMIISGMALPRALNTLALVSPNKKFKQALLKIKSEIIKGKTFSESLEIFPNIFSELFCNMIKAGEESGTMEGNLKSLSHQMEREVELKSKIIGALIYPAVIVITMMIIGILMLILVVPNLAAVFEDLGIELPFTTRIVIFLGTSLADYWYLFFLGFVALFALIRLGLKNKKSRKKFDGLVLKLPVVSTLIKKTNAALTSRTLSSLFSAGIPMVKALEISSNALSNYYFKQALVEASKRVEKGEKLSDVLTNYSHLYPLTIIQMIKVGEETGETTDILGKMADFYEEEVSNATKNISSVIEPILMLLIGGAVGFFAVSMIQPMYSMMETL